MEDLDALKSDPAVLKIYGQYVRGLKKSGNLYTGSCPLHQDSHPSFSVYPDMRWTCFSGADCGSGNIFQLIERVDKISFQEAVEKVKIELGQTSSWEEAKTKVEATFKSVAESKVYKVIDLSRWGALEKALANSEAACTFLREERGITLATAQQLRLGFAKNIGTLAGQDGADIADKGWIAFPSIEGDKVIGIKYRSIIRKKPAGFSRQPSMATALFNTEAIDCFEPVYVTEGECLLGDTEVLTPAGWARLDSYAGQKVAQWFLGGRSEFVEPSAYINKEYQGEVFSFGSNSSLVDQTVTPGHRVLYCSESSRKHITGDSPVVRRAEEVPGRGIRFYRTSHLEAPGVSLTDPEIRLQVMIQADASVESRAEEKDLEGRYWQALDSDGWRIEVSKQRKKDRIRKLLKEADVPFTEYLTKRGSLIVRFKTPPGRLHKIFPDNLYLMSEDQRMIFLDELQYWDSHTNKAGTRMYVSTIKSNSDLVQTVFACSGFSAKFGSEIRGGTRSEKFWVLVSLRDKRGRHDLTSGTTIKKTVSRYEGRVYCLTVPSSFLLIRRNNVISVTGNCDTAVLEQVGFHAVSVPSAGTKLTPGMKDQLMKASYVVLAGDTDATGSGYMGKLWKELGEKTYLLTWPDGAKDANQCFLETCGRDLSKFKNLVDELTSKAKSQPLPDIYSIQEIMKNGEDTSLADRPDRLRFPWKAVDDAAILLPGSVLGVMATATGQGKTAFTLQYSLFGARKYNETVVNWQCELSPSEISVMVAAQVLRKNRNFITKEDLKLAAEELEGVQYYIGNNSTINNINEVLDIMEAAIRRTGATQAVLDNIHYYTSGVDDDVRVLAAALKRIKQMSITYGVKFTVVFQPRKASQQTRGKKVQISDVKGSASAGDTCDAVVAIHRELAKSSEGEEAKNDIYDERTLVEWLKTRSKGIGKASTYVQFFGEFASFEQIDTNHEEEDPNGFE